STTNEVYGRFNLKKFATEIRQEAIDILRRDSRFEFTGGTSLALYGQSLLEAAGSQVCIDLPGNGPFCYRLVEYLAMGCCVVGPRHAAVMQAELQDREHVVYCKDDLSDLADLCVEYLQDGEARARVGANAARFFDEHLYHTQLAPYYVETCERLLVPG